MAARRLIVVLLVLLAVSIGAAAVAPERQGGSFVDSDEPTTSTTTPDETATPSGETLGRTLVADPERPATVRAAVGDQVDLSVESAAPLQIAIETLGLLEFAEPLTPARFNILLREPGVLPITDPESDEVVGRIVVEELGKDGQAGGA